MYVHILSQFLNGAKTFNAVVIDCYNPSMEERGRTLHIQFYYTQTRFGACLLQCAKEQYLKSKQSANVISLRWLPQKFLNVYHVVLTEDLCKFCISIKRLECQAGDPLNC